ncbi:hypothetical protein RhiLY_09555 [Ceratobasidium sp. AG-Ba]|nr:hypothetical protein RhiLY_09555 [Ceratobasidium sp. AG-Ba]
MRRDERRQDMPSIGTYAYPHHPIYTLSDDGLAAYPGPSSSAGTYGFNHSHESHGYPTAPYSHDLPGSLDSTPVSSAWVDVPLDPNAIYHMYHPPAWSGAANSESPYEYDRLVLRQAWEQRTREQWFRRNGITASSADQQYDRFIPELRVGEYVERYLARPDVPRRPSIDASMQAAYVADVHEPHPQRIDPAVEYSALSTSNQYYQPHVFNDQSSQSIPSSTINLSSIHDSIPSPSTVHIPNTFSLHPPYRERTSAYSPTDTESPTNLHPTTHTSKLSASPVTVLSPLGSDAAESPLSDSYHPHPTSPVTSEPVISDPIASPTTELEIKTEPPNEVRAKSEDSSGHAAMGPIRRGNSAGDRGKNAAGAIRVQRPAGIKWNQRTRCAYINPVTGLQCRTSAGRGPDLERHL